MKLFLDTNVWASALLTAGLCEELLAKTCAEGMALTSELVWTELAAVLTRKLRAADSTLGSARILWQSALCVEEVPVPTDDNDARLVAAAVAAGAKWFVTGDKRILSWQRSGETRIVCPRDAWVQRFAPHLAL